MYVSLSGMQGLSTLCSHKMNTRGNLGMKQKKCVSKLYLYFSNQKKQFNLSRSRISMKKNGKLRLVKSIKEYNLDVLKDCRFDLWNHKETFDWLSNNSKYATPDDFEVFRSHSVNGEMLLNWTVEQWTQIGVTLDTAQEIERSAWILNTGLRKYLRNEIEATIFESLLENDTSVYDITSDNEKIEFFNIKSLFCRKYALNFIESSKLNAVKRLLEKKDLTPREADRRSEILSLNPEQFVKNSI
eukprot:TRINITY_DN2046_c0_g1_i2.p1 TRINITY_DN2046_c0_g1~~TRINITY_DN2046_c0_g1_i2.p1  ORF type:complete len:243 (-),score=42.24 TRINITY_DN2046_c0_g1_i2:659-1387(-)